MADCTNLRQQGITLIQKAIKYDQEGEYEAALRYYKQALDCFIPALRLERNPKIKSTLIPKVKEYMDRAEEIQSYMDQERTFENELSLAPGVPAAAPKQAAPAPQKTLAAPIAASGGYAQPQPKPQPQPKSNDLAPTQSQSTMDILSMFPKLPQDKPKEPSPPAQQAAAIPSQGHSSLISIKSGQMQCGYETLFGSYMHDVTSCTIEEPSVKTPSEMRNLLHFCEVVIKASHSPKISFELVTLLDSNSEEAASEQQSNLLEFALCLESAGHSLKPTFVDEPIAPKVTLNNGTVIKSPDYGLNFYEEPEFSFWIGLTEYDLRRCKETTIEISHP